MPRVLETKYSLRYYQMTNVISTSSGDLTTCRASCYLNRAQDVIHCFLFKCQPVVSPPYHCFPEASLTFSNSDSDTLIVHYTKWKCVIALRNETEKELSP